MTQMTDKQEAFAQAYVANGGNGHRAAVEAGFAHPHVAASKLMAKPHVAARIRQMIGFDMTAKLPQIVQATYDLAFSKDTPPRERLTALLALMDRGGLTVPRNAPGVAVQVNVDTASEGVSAAEAIRDIERMRAARLAGRLDS